MTHPQRGLVRGPSDEFSCQLAEAGERVVHADVACVAWPASKATMVRVMLAGVQIASPRPQTSCKKAARSCLKSLGSRPAASSMTLRTGSKASGRSRAGGRPGRLSRSG